MLLEAETRLVLCLFSDDVTGEMQQANREIFSALFFALHRSTRGGGEGDPFVARCRGTTAV